MEAPSINYTITNKEYKSRERFRFYLMVPASLGIMAIFFLVFFTAGLTWYFAGLVAIAITMLPVGYSLKHILGFLKGDTVYALDESGLTIIRNNKIQKHTWAGFDAFFTDREYLDRHRYGSTAPNLGSPLVERVHGNLYYLQYRKRQLIFFRKNHFMLYAEPDNYKQVAEILSYYIK